MKIYIIGGGFSGLAAATILASEGHQVTILEKTIHLGVGQGEYKKKGSPLIWDLLGIGCLMFLKGIFIFLEKNFRLLSTKTFGSFLFGVFFKRYLPSSSR